MVFTWLSDLFARLSGLLLTGANWLHTEDDFLTNAEAEAAQQAFHPRVRQQGRPRAGDGPLPAARALTDGLR